MNSSSRRFEILLPLRFNDGQPVPDEGQSYRDDLVRVFVDVPDVAESRQFFLEFKERLKARFRQIDIWMTTYPIELL